MNKIKLVRKGFWLTKEQAKFVEKRRKGFGSDSGFIRFLIEGAMQDKGNKTE
jgi:hypothetical protein